MLRRPPVRKAVRLLAGSFVTVSLVATLALILLPTLGRALDHRTVVVTTGSMRPTIDPGDAVVLEKVAAEGIDVGDAITYGTSSEDGLVTHRVVAVREIGGAIWFQTKGDANEQPDPDLTPFAVVEGRVRWTVPRLGSLMITALSPWGMVVLLGLPAALLFLREALALRPGWRRSTPDGGARWPESAAAG